MRRRTLAVSIAVLAVATVVLAIAAWQDPAFFSGGGSGQTMTLLTSGSWGEVGPAGTSFCSFSPPTAGTLRGTFVFSGNDQAAMFIYTQAQAQNSDINGPAGYLYSSGWVSSGELSVHFASGGGWYWVGTWAKPGAFSEMNQLNVTFTWTSALEFDS